MEGADCPTIRTDVGKPTDDELHDSGCEQSPTTPSPSLTECDQSNSSSVPVRTYDREFLLSRQFTPLALNPNAKELLWPPFQETADATSIFDPSRCFYTKEEQNGASATRKEMQPECFKPVMLESNSDVLRPQRNSFVGGCKMRNSSISESGDKASSGTGKSTSSAQRRTSESTDRPRSGPNLGERKTAGRGRIVFDRSESQGSAERAIPPSREKIIRPSSDKYGNWRQRVLGNEEPKSNGRDSREHSRTSYTNGYNSRRGNQQDPDPSWFTENVSTSDTIELKGFEGHQESIDRREKEKHKKKDKRNKERTEEKPAPITSRSEPVVSEHPGADLSEQDPLSEPVPSTQPPSMFDFNKFLDLQVNNDILIPAPPLSGDKSSSRANQWFKKEEDESGDTHDFISPAPNFLNNLPGTVDEEFQLDPILQMGHMNSFVQNLISPAGLADGEPLMGKSAKAGKEPGDGDPILKFLSSLQVSSSQPKPDNKTAETTNQLPKVLSDIKLPANSVKPDLPTKYTTLDELEGNLKPTAKAGVGKEEHVKSIKSHVRPSVQHVGQSKAKGEQEMTAYNKLLGMLQGTGELEKSVPRMPEVTNKVTPSQLKKSAPVSVAENISPVLTAHSQAAIQDTIAAQANVAAALLGRDPSYSHNIPSSVSLPNTAPSATFMNPQQGLGFIPMSGMMQPPPQTVNMATAFPGPVNPILQHTIQQRQKLPSPIMFSTQPPVHIVAPAPIHPMGSAQASMMGQQGMVGQQNMPMNNQSQQAAASVASMAFTPTSVIRKLANDKVDERQRHVDTGPTKQMYDHNMQQQHMRPIVKSNAHSVAEQMKRMLEDQSQQRAASMSQYSHQMHMYGQQQPTVSQHSKPLFQPVSNINGMFPQQQMMHSHRFQPSPNMPQPHNSQPMNMEGQAAPLQSLQQQLVQMQQAQQQAHQQLQSQQVQQFQSHQQLRNNGANNSSSMDSPNNSSDIISKLFCGAELAGQSNRPLPKHVNMLTLDDIEH